MSEYMNLRTFFHPNVKATLLVSLAWLLAGGMASPPVAAEGVDSERAMKSIARAKWYDEEQQSYAPPKVSPLRDNPLRQDGRKAKIKPPAANKPWNWGNLGWLFSDFLSWGLIGLLAAALVTGLVLLSIHAFRNYLPAQLDLAGSKAGIKIDPTRVVDLPFDVAPTNNDPLTEAERLWRAERFDEAIVFLYGYMLLALDQARRIHLQKGKTNRMYLREIKHAGLKRMVESTMLSFESVFFGKHSLSRESFELIWSQLDEFHQLLAPAPAAATGTPTAKVAHA